MEERSVKKIIIALLCACLFLALLSACGQQRDLAAMESVLINDQRGIVWENRTYTPFCVVSKKDCGEQIGYVDGDTDDRVSEYKGYSPDEWLVSWMPMDGGAMLLKEQSVTEIPDGLEAEYE